MSAGNSQNETSSGQIVPSVSVVTATAIAVADMIGTGVFTSLGFQVPGIPSGFSLLMLWVIGGIVALCGALSYAELSAAFPRSGGEYNFLSRVYRPAVGFLAGWISVTVGFAAPVAIAAIAFGDYFQGLVPGSSPLITGLLLIWISTAILITGMKQSSAFQNIMTALKILLIVVLIGAGFAMGPSRVNPTTSISFLTKRVRSRRWSGKPPRSARRAPISWSPSCIPAAPRMRKCTACVRPMSS